MPRRRPAAAAGGRPAPRRRLQAAWLGASAAAVRLLGPGAEAAAPSAAAFAGPRASAARAPHREARGAPRGQRTARAAFFPMPWGAAAICSVFKARDWMMCKLGGLMGIFGMLQWWGSPSEQVKLLPEKASVQIAQGVPHEVADDVGRVAPEMYHEASPAEQPVALPDLAAAAQVAAALPDAAPPSGGGGGLPEAAALAVGQPAALAAPAAPLAAEAAPPAAPPVAPAVPGLSEADLIVKVSTDSKTGHVRQAGEAGARGLMAQRCSVILGQMARDGWEVTEVAASGGEFQVVLPAVRYETPLAVVTMPAPRFQCFTYDSDLTDGDYKERLVGDLILTNGTDILNVELRFPNKSFSITAAGWARCHVGHELDRTRMQVDVEIGVQLPRVPGLTAVMDYFIKTYANQSAQDCVNALATGAEEIAARDAP